MLKLKLLEYPLFPLLRDAFDKDEEVRLILKTVIVLEDKEIGQIPPEEIAKLEYI